MGAAASTLSSKLTKEECYSAIGKERYLEVWNRYKDEKGMVDIPKLVELKNIQFDVFLSHNWSKDEVGRLNHERVGKVNDYLMQRGVKTWFDVQKLKGDVQQEMCKGIDESKIIFVFITQVYLEKVCSFIFLLLCERFYLFLLVRCEALTLTTIA